MVNVMRRVRFLLSEFLFVAAFLTSSASAQVLNVTPTLDGSVFPGTFLNACNNVPQWARVYRKAKYLGAKDLLADASQTSLQSCFSQMNSRGLQLSIETGVIDPFTTGEDAFNTNRQKWDLLISLGAPLTTFRIDEARTHAAQKGWSSADAVRETVDWIELVRIYYPGKKIHAIEAYPYLSSSTINSFVNSVNSDAVARGVTGFDAIEIDHGWYGHDGPWSASALNSIRTNAHSQGMDFELIFFGGCPLSNPGCSFDTRLQEQWRAYKLNGVSTPDIYIIESWDDGGVPATTANENSPGSFMYGSRRLVALVGNIPNIRGLLSGTPCERDPVVSFRTNDTGQYMTTSIYPVYATKSSAGFYERFPVKDHNGGCFYANDVASFRELGNMRWLQAREGGGYELNPNGTNPDAWEQFTMIRLAGSGQITNNNSVALRTSGNLGVLYYVVAELGGGSEVNANRTAIGGWETWTIVIH